MEDNVWEKIRKLELVCIYLLIFVYSSFYLKIVSSLIYEKGIEKFFFNSVWNFD